MLLFQATPARAQISVGIEMPGIDIGINVPVYPDLVPVPGYPVYYDPRADSNYFFYDGMYWVYQGDTWYASSWYNGPWQSYGPEDVPLFVLRVPVRYYREPPVYFRGWVADAPPRWGEHWGRGWETRRAGWDHWDRRSAPRAAPLPAYQARFSGDRYPRAVEQQRSIRTENYAYRPREPVARAQPPQRGWPAQKGATPVANAPRPQAPTAVRGPAQRTTFQPNQQRGEQQSQVPRPEPTVRASQPAGPAHEAQRASRPHEQQPPRERQQPGQEGKEEGRGQEHR
jgi:hypothetical protein